MARPLRIVYEEAVYRITIHGNDRNAIFRAHDDRERFIRVLAESVWRNDVRLHPYCLMNNHVHRVLEAPRGNVRVGPRPTLSNIASLARS